jgi:LacI family transcriptional regulator
VSDEFYQKGKRGRPTVFDLAQAAKVSVATVDRVINGRLPVKPSTAKRVQEAAQTIGFHAAGTISRRSMGLHRPLLRLGFVLQRRTTQFYRNLGTALETASRSSPKVQGQAVVEFLEDLSPASVADRVRRMGQRVDALAVVAADHPFVSRAISDLHEQGKPTIALLSDLTAPVGYIGWNWRKTGRTAGWAMPRLAGRTGKVAIVLGSHRYQGHEICEVSFRSYLREHAAELQLLEPLVSLEEPRLAYESVLDLLRRVPDLGGIYVPGGGMEGVLQALREVETIRHVAVICHELTDETREGLIDGTIDLVISHPLTLLAEAAVEVMRTAVEDCREQAMSAKSNLEGGLGRSRRQGVMEIFVPMELYTPENV